MGAAKPQVVSVVIPTVGRPELERAVRSAKKQLGVSVEILIVVDRSEEVIELPEAVLEMASTVLWTGGGRGGSAARNEGVKAASGTWVAFLDDDDEWLPTKLSTQLELLQDAGRSGVVATRHTQVHAGSSKESLALPRKLISPDQNIGDYLFAERRPAGGRASMYTSTLLCSRELAAAVPWDESLRRHQDWDWLVRLGGRPDVRFLQAPEALVRIQTGSAGSISAGKSWADSLGWADTVLAPTVSAKTFVDFLAAQTLRYAIAARSARGVYRVLARIAAARAVPSIGPALIAVGGMLPRSLIERIMIAVR